MQIIVLLWAERRLGEYLASSISYNNPSISPETPLLVRSRQMTACKAMQDVKGVAKNGSHYYVT
jgi:hypothetical protein